MNLSYSLILAFVSIAESTWAYVAFGNSLETVRFEVIKYCDDPTGYDKSSSGEEYGFGPIKDWNVSALTSMHTLFSPFSSLGPIYDCPNCSTCNPPVGNWDVSAVEIFVSIFFTRWDVINAVTFVHLFHTMIYSNEIIWFYSFIHRYLFVVLYYLQFESS